MGLLVSHGSCIMGHGSLSAWVTGSWVNASDPLPALISVDANDNSNVFVYSRRDDGTVDNTHVYW